MDTTKLLTSKSIVDSVLKGQQEIARRKKDAENAQIQIPQMLSGAATWIALQQSVDDLVKEVPDGHDVLLLVNGIKVETSHFLQPHTFRFDGYGDDGLKTSMVCHFSQVVARVVYAPQMGPKRIITGFGNDE